MAEDKDKPGFLRRLLGWGADEAKPSGATRTQETPPAAPPKAPAKKTPKTPPKAKAKAPAKTPPKPGRKQGKPAGKAKRGAAQRPPATDAAKVIPFPRPAPRIVPTAVPTEPAPAPVSLPKERNAPAPPAAPGPDPGTPKPKGWLARLKDGLARTSTALGDNIQTIFTRRKLDEATLQELEDVLIQADLGVDAAARITEAVAQGRYDKEIAPEEVRRVLADEVARVLAPVARPLALDEAHRPHVILVVGVNGTGKTTTIGKLAHRFAGEGKRVVLAAGDTFRAAAIDQLKIWGERTGATVVARDVGADAAGLAYDALEAARQAQAQVLMIDTAGRLQNKADLMAELAKVVRVLKKLDATAPHSVLLVVDATTGQNAVAQADVFREIAGVTGIIMTKLDGTARGGILVAIADKHGLPVHAVGVGEGIDDLQPFEAREFAAAIAGQQK